MYRLVLTLHSDFRWVVLALGILALARALRGSWQRAPWGPVDERLARAFLAALDTQVLLGIGLWVFLSPFAQAFREAPGVAMGDAEVRFWGMEHQVAMVLGFAAAHAGRARGRRHGEGWLRHRTQAITLFVWIALVASAWPWRGTKHGRPLYRAELVLPGGAGDRPA